MTEIRLLDLFGPVCVDPVDGAKLCARIQEALGQGKTVSLNVSGVKTLAGAFLTTAVGCLYGDFAKEDLDTRVLWHGLDPTDEAMMRLVQRNAIRFHSATKSQKSALHSASARAALE